MLEDDSDKSIDDVIEEMYSNRLAIIEEIADVYVMLYQLGLIFGEENIKE